MLFLRLINRSLQPDCGDRRFVLGSGLGVLLAALQAKAHAKEPASPPLPAGDAAQPRSLEAVDDAWVEVWVDLSEPVPAAVAEGSDPQVADRRRQRVSRQQDRVGRALAALGAVEFARIGHVHNAIAVRMPEQQRAKVQAIPGVVRLRPTRVLHPPRTTSPPSNDPLL